MEGERQRETSARPVRPNPFWMSDVPGEHACPRLVLAGGGERSGGGRRDGGAQGGKGVAKLAYDDAQKKMECWLQGRRLGRHRQRAASVNLPKRGPRGHPCRTAVVRPMRKLACAPLLPEQLQHGRIGTPQERELQGPFMQRRKARCLWVREARRGPAPLPNRVSWVGHGCQAVNVVGPEAVARRTRKDGPSPAGGGP